MALGSFKLECRFDDRGLFTAADADAFSRRYAEVKPLYAADLAQLRQDGR